MAFAVFGPGSLYLTRTDVPLSTPINIGYSQEFSLDQSAENKELYGQNQYPLVVARGTIKITGKAKAAEISGIALNNAWMGEASFASGALLMAQGEAGTVPAPSGPYTVTVAHSATFDTDLGVQDATTGLPLQKVVSGPATGQYSVSAGVYTFAAADANRTVLINYAYTSNVATSQMITATNRPIGFTPTFQLDYVTQLNNKPYYLRLFSCVSSKLQQSFKLTDFSMPEIDFSVFANAAGKVYTASYPEVS